MHRPNDLGLIYGPYGGIGFVQRIEARKSADCFAWARSLMRRVMSIFL